MDIDDRAVDNPTADDCERGLAEARELAARIVRGEGDPMRLANAIYWAGWNNGGFAGPSDDPTCPELNDVAAEFVQLVDSVVIYPDKAASKPELEALIRQAAEAFLEGKPFPQPDAGATR